MTMTLTIAINLPGEFSKYYCAFSFSHCTVAAGTTCCLHCPSIYVYMGGWVHLQISTISLVKKSSPVTNDCSVQLNMCHIFMWANGYIFGFKIEVFLIQTAGMDITVAGLYPAIQ
jgi:hypothetical protein